MIEFIVTTTVVAFLAGGVFAEVVKPATNYAIDKGKVGYEYVQAKLD